MKRRPDDLSLIGRLALMFLGLGLASTWNPESPIACLVALVGYAIFLAGLGVIELALALWYRAQRHRSSLR